MGKNKKNDGVFVDTLDDGLDIIDDYTEVSESEEPKKKNRLKKWGIRSLVTLVVLVTLYLTAVYSNIPFIAKWRTIYIETAMSTMNHKWLATYFIPKSVIDAVMAKRQEEFDKQANLQSSWGTEEEDSDSTKKEF